MENLIALQKNLKFVGIIAKTEVEILPIIEEISKILRLGGIEILCEKTCAQYFGKTGFSIDEILSRTKVLISLGGDGTLIGVARSVLKKGAYIIGVNAGTLGFLTDIKNSEFNAFWREFMAGKFRLDKLPVLSVSLERKNGEKLEISAFNDMVITRSHISSMAKIDAFLDDTHFNTYYGDGVIISSPAGSTAYNMSANGAIIYPLCEVFAITPICSHSLTQRPLILPKRYKLGFKNSGNSELCVVIDGQNFYNMDEFKSVEVKISKHKSQIIRASSYDYFAVLKEKLRWGHAGC